jgi:hypothetical protein
VLKDEPPGTFWETKNKTYRVLVFKHTGFIRRRRLTQDEETEDDLECQLKSHKLLRLGDRSKHDQPEISKKQGWGQENRTQSLASKQS